MGAGATSSNGSRYQGMEIFRSRPPSARAWGPCGAPLRGAPGGQITADFSGLLTDRGRGVAPPPHLQRGLCWRGVRSRRFNKWSCSLSRGTLLHSPCLLARRLVCVCVCVCAHLIVKFTGECYIDGRWPVDGYYELPHKILVCILVFPIAHPLKNIVYKKTTRARGASSLCLA